MTGTWRNKYPIGSRKGNGIKRIVDTCARFNIEVRILSHHGYLILDKNGKPSRIGDGYRDNRVFAGTLFSLRIPAD